MSTVHQIYLELERISTVLASTGGRDKVMRFIDYGTRATSYYLTTAAPNDSKTKTVKNLEAHLIQSRKLFRLGKFIEFIVAFVKVLKSSRDPLTILLAFGKNLGYGTWLFYDNLVYLAKLNLINGDNVAKWDKRSAKFWFFGILCAVLINLRTIIQNSLLGKQTPSSEYLQLTRNTLDLVTPGFKLDMAPVKLVAPNKGVVGLLGTISSMISIYLLWPALPKSTK